MYEMSEQETITIYPVQIVNFQKKYLLEIFYIELGESIGNVPLYTSTFSELSETFRVDRGRRADRFFYKTIRRFNVI